MLADPPTEQDAVVFTSPLAQRLWSMFITGLAAFVFVLILPLIVWGVVGFASVWKTPPWWWHLAGLAMVIGGAWLTAGAARNTLRRRLKLYDDRFWVGGRFFGRDFTYDSVRLLQLDRPAKTVGKACKLMIQVRGRKTVSLWLKRRDADECFDAMQRLCPQSGSIGVSGFVALPEDEAARVDVHQALARTFSRKAAGLIAVSALLLVWWGGVAGAWLFSSGGHTSQATSPRLGFFLVLMPFAIISSIAGAVRCLRTARFHRAQAAGT